MSPCVVPPPGTFEDIPRSIADAYMASGVPITEHHAKIMVSHWSDYSNGWSLPEDVEPIAYGFAVNLSHSLGYDAWIPKLQELMKGPVPEELERTLHERLIRWLAPIMMLHDLYQLKKGESYPWMILPEFLPRSEEECDGLFQAFAGATAREERHAILSVLGRSSREYKTALHEKITSFHRELYSTEPELYAGMDVGWAWYDVGIRHVLEPINDPALLIEMMYAGDNKLRAHALSVYDQLEGRNWTKIYDLARQHPEDVAKAWDVKHADATLLQILWDTNEYKVQHNALSTLFCSARVDKKECDAATERERVTSVLDLLKSWFEKDRKAVSEAYKSQYGVILHSRPAETLTRLWDLDIPLLQEWVSDGILHQLGDYVHYKKDNFMYGSLKEGDDVALRSLWLRVLPERPYDFYHWATPLHEKKDIEGLLRYVPREMAPHLFPALIDLAKSPKARALTYERPVWDIVRDYMARLPVRQLDEGGLFSSEDPKVRDIGIEALVASEDPATTRVMKELCQRDETTIAEKGILLDRLEELGEDVSELDEDGRLSLEDWQEVAAKARLGVIPKDLCGTQVIDFLAPFGEKLTRHFITLASKVEEGRVPRRARYMLRALPEVTPMELTERFFDFWLEIDGNPKFSWMLNFVSEYGDDRFVQPIKRAINTWYKKAKPRAILAIRALGRIGSTYALSVLDEIAGSGKYSESLVVNARRGLDAACRRRGTSRDELAEELIPDFGVTKDGLSLDLGPRKVIVTIDLQLHLRVSHETGKTTKSFPKRKNDEDAAKHKEARGRFDILRKNLKPVLKRQMERMEECLLTASFYVAPRWNRIYQDHALLSHLLQGVIWTRMSRRFEPLESFRISEDGSLIDAQQDAVAIANDDLIGLWHPVVSNESERHALTEHISDYKLLDVLGQLERRVYTLADSEAQSTQITRFDGHTLPSMYLKGRLRSLGFQPIVGDGARIDAHVKVYDSAGLTVRIDHSDVDVSFEEAEEVTLTYATVFVSEKYRKRHGLREEGIVTLGELPPALVCCLMESLERLAELGGSAPVL